MISSNLISKFNKYFSNLLENLSAEVKTSLTTFHLVYNVLYSDKVLSYTWDFVYFFLKSILSGSVDSSWTRGVFRSRSEAALVYLTLFGSETQTFNLNLNLSITNLWELWQSCCQLEWCCWCCHCSPDTDHPLNCSWNWSLFSEVSCLGFAYNVGMASFSASNRLETMEASMLICPLRMSFRLSRSACMLFTSRSKSSLVICLCSTGLLVGVTNVSV